jgi:hypothetical protein
MPTYRLFLVSEPVTVYEFSDQRPMQDLAAAIVRDGYCSFEGISNRTGPANPPRQRQTVFIANIGRLIEL